MQIVGCYPTECILLPDLRLHPPVEPEEYAAAATNALCRHLGAVQSMGRVALDNSPAESFNSTLKVEFAHRHRFRTRAEAAVRIVTWITVLQPAPPPQPVRRNYHRSTTRSTWPPSERPRQRPYHETRPHKKEPPHFEGIEIIRSDAICLTALGLRLTLRTSGYPAR